MRPYAVTTTVLSNDADGICASQTPAAGGVQSLTINGALSAGGVATCAEAQIVTITSVGNESGRTFSVTGTDADGTIVTESVTGANAGAAVTTGYFKTVTGITVDDDTADAVTVGPVASNGAVTRSYRVNRNQPDFGLGLYVEIPSASTITVTAQFSPDWPESGDWTSSSYSNNADWRTVDGLSAITATDESNIAFPVECVRLNITANTAGGCTFTVQQSY